MAKRTVEIEDNLQEIVDGANEELRDHFLDYLTEHAAEADEDKDFVGDTYYQSVAVDFIHETADSSTPIYYSDIDGLYFLYGDEFEEAYKNAGLGDGGEDNHRQVTIYCYISDKLFDRYRRIEELWNDRESEKDEGESSLDYMRRELAS